MTRRLDWVHIVGHARAFADEMSASVGVAPTLRQCFYALVAQQLLPNTLAAYKTLSAQTAKARRSGAFPELTDLTRRIERAPSWAGPGSALDALAAQYRRDRTAGQPVSVYIGVEKKGFVAQFDSWFGGLGIPIVALGGYSSQSYCDEVARDVEAQDRKAVLLYAGDFDPSGEDIDRDFVKRSGCFDDVIRVALTAEQVTAYDLPPAMGKAKDSRASQFVARHGRLVQVELDALAPPDLRTLYQAAIDEFWDMSAFDEVVALEREERELLGRLAAADPGDLEAYAWGRER